MGKEEYKFISFTYPIDRKLYKYFKNIDYAIDSIRSRRIHLDNPSSYNDPFDTVFLQSNYAYLCTEENISEILDIVRSCVRKFSENASQRAEDKIIKAINTCLSSLDTNPFRSGICGIHDGVRRIYKAFNSDEFTFKDFCEVINDGYKLTNAFVTVDCKASCFSEVYDSILMWSYYADNHRGVCAEYDLSLLDFSYPINRNIIQCLSKVQYSPLRTDLFTSVDGTPHFHYLISKADVWSHEHEWRIVCESEEEYLPFDCISGVYLGVNFDQRLPQYASLCEAVDTHRNLSIFKGKRNPETYSINFAPIYTSGTENINQTVDRISASLKVANQVFFG